MIWLLDICIVRFSEINCFNCYKVILLGRKFSSRINSHPFLINKIFLFSFTICIITLRWNFHKYKILWVLTLYISPLSIIIRLNHWSEHARSMSVRHFTRHNLSLDQRRTTWYIDLHSSIWSLLVLKYCVSCLKSSRSY